MQDRRLAYGGEGRKFVHNKWSVRKNAFGSALDGKTGLDVSELWGESGDPCGLVPLVNGVDWLTRRYPFSSPLPPPARRQRRAGGGRGEFRFCGNVARSPLAPAGQARWRLSGHRGTYLNNIWDNPNNACLSHLTVLAGSGVRVEDEKALQTYLIPQSRSARSG